MGNQVIDISTGFEGPEKKLEIDFEETSSELGLRKYNATEWQTVLSHVRCTIISTTRNQHFDSYVLSESSLFVFPYKIVLKTCGTTTLLKCLPSLLEYATAIGTKPVFVAFSRKNFYFPDHQPYPHNGFHSEVSYLNSVFPGGKGYEFGSENSLDKWYLYIADFTDNLAPTSSQDQTFEVIMCDLDPKAMEQFYKTDKFVSASKVTETSGIGDLLPGAVTDEFMFDPCGYSVNGLRDNAYFTIHVTPEPEFSFVSFETNLELSNYQELLDKVIDIFNPGRFVVLVFADKFSKANQSSHDFKTAGYRLCDQFKREFSEYYLTVATLKGRRPMKTATTKTIKSL